MNENRRRILTLLAEQKITADEAERLLAALDAGPTAGLGETSASSSGTAGNAGVKTESSKGRARYLRVLVDAEEGHYGNPGPTSVNIRVPMQLLRAGVRLASLIPVQAHQHLDEALSRHGVPLTLSQIKPENLEELVDHLDDLTVDVASSEQHGRVKVKVFSE